MSALSPGRFRIDAWFVFVLGILLIVASILKEHQIAYRGTYEGVVVKSVPLNSLLIALEFLFGAWLLTGLYQYRSRYVAIAWFCGVLEIAIWASMNDRRSCGLLGAVVVRPWIAVVIGCAILGGLFFLRWDDRERTIQTHPLRFWRFVIVSVAVCIPGLVMLLSFAREAQYFSHDLRHDLLLHSTKIAVNMDNPTVEGLVDLVTAELGLPCSVDSNVQKYFSGCHPDWARINHKKVRGWEALEAISQRMPVRSRWVKRANEVGYSLIADDPLQRSIPYWLGSLNFGVIALALLEWHARNNQSRSSNLPGASIKSVGDLARGI